LTIPFLSLEFNFIGLAIGLPELVFFILCPLAVIRIKFSGEKLSIDGLDLFVFGWLLANILSGWHSGFNSIVVIEIIKTAYLVLLFMILKWTITPLMIERIVKVLVLSSVLAALTGIIGLGLGYIGIETFLAIKRPYPYLIHVIQAQGFTSSPNMLASIIMIGILFQIHEIFSNKIFNISNILIIMILLIGFLLTFSKTIVCLFIGVALIWYFHNKSILSSTLQMITRIVIAGLFIVYILGTHFIIVEKDQNPELLKGDYIAGSALIEIDNYSMYPSQYWSLKEISLEAISQSFLWGLGPGKFNGFAHEFKKNDAYSTHVPYPAPHCTYLGTLTENGLFGLIAFVGIIFFITKMSRKILNENSTYPYLLTCLPSIFIAIGIEAVSTDVMNFRHYWILLVLLVCTFQNVKSTSSKSLNL
jgi:O-antigen ligase